MDENRLEFEQQQEIVLTYRPAPQAREVVLRCERELPPCMRPAEPPPIVMAAKSPVMCCDIPAYGSYIHGENEEWIDYYFIAGNEEEIMENYGRLFSAL